MFWWYHPPLIDPFVAQIVPIVACLVFLAKMRRSVRDALWAGLAASAVSATAYIGILVFEAFQRDPSPYLALVGLGWVFAWLAYVGPCLILSIVIFASSSFFARQRARP